MKRLEKFAFAMAVQYTIVGVGVTDLKLGIVGERTAELSLGYAIHKNGDDVPAVPRVCHSPGENVCHENEGNWW